MTIPIWPASLPAAVLRADYEESLPELRLRTSTDIGPAKVRRRSSAGVRPVSGSMVLTKSQRDALIAFYRSDLVEGSLRFSMADTLDSSQTAEFRFVDPPKFSQTGTHYKVTLSLEIMP